VIIKTGGKIMKGKTEFGCDYLNIMRNLELKAKTDGEVDPVADAALLLFLVNWGFTKNEISEVNKLFFDRYKDISLVEANLSKAIDTVIDYIKEDKAAQERLFIELVSIATIDNEANENEQAFLVYFRDILGIKPPEINALVNKGGDLTTALNYFGNTFIKNRKPTEG
jgi:hypothetical protein